MRTFETWAAKKCHEPSRPDLVHEEGIEILEREETKTPRLYRVILHNDDYTTRTFVVEVLMRFFRKAGAEANQIMLKAHQTGKAVVALYTKDIAETKVQQVTEYARKEGFPLLMTMEPES
ncbi:MAG: ATP-dependent Clp protease adaptor ClpS [Myxococcota bacterium]